MTTFPSADDLYALLSTTRSIRRISDAPVTEEVLRRIMQAAVWAPSGGNRQPWRIIAVRDRNIKEKIGRLYAAEWEQYVEYNVSKFEGQPPAVVAQVREAYSGGTRLTETLADVPVLAMFIHDPSALYVTDANLGRHPVVGGASLYPAVQNFLLAARAEGLGGVLTTLVCNRETELRDILKFPTGWGVHAMVPLGHPKGNHGPITRSSVDEMTSIDQWKN
jgi:nitroreductase